MIVEELSSSINKVQVVTALYNLNRHVSDGRSFPTYSRWLEDTLNLFPDAIVFHDNSLDAKRFSKFSKATFVGCDFSNLPLSEFRERIGFLSASEPYLSKSDLVYKNVDYGILINSKIEFLLQASRIKVTEGYLWVDAGISRFNLATFNPHLEFSRFTLLFDIKNYLRNSIKSRSFKLIKVTPFGSSNRIIGGVTIYVPYKNIGEIANSYNKFVTSHLHEGLWDTEQVFLAYFSKSLSTSYLLQLSSSVGQMINSRNFFHKNLSAIATRVLRRLL